METFTRNEYVQPLVEKRDHSYDLRQILSEAGHITREEKKFLGCSGSQLMLATVPGVQDPSHHGCGTLEDPFANRNSVPSDAFTEFNPKYQGYYLEGIWKTFPYKIGRMSLMVLWHYSCLPIATDGKDRLVYAIWSEKDVYHIYDNHPQWYHIPLDEHLYYVRGDRKHTLYNGTNEAALFLIFELPSTQG